MKRFLSVILSISIIFSTVFMVPALAAYENTYVNTGNQIEDLIGVATTQIGYREGNSSSQLGGTTAGSENYTKYGQWYGINPGAWCAMFVSWCANQAGISTSIIPKHASCDVGMNWFKNQGRWGWGKYWGNNQGKAVYTPVRGDIIYFGNGDLSDSTHVGIVYKVDSTYVYTIEGNTSNKCAYKQYSLGDAYIYGYGHPAYSGDTAPTGASEISISTDATYPTSLTVGQSFSLKGTVSSKYNLTKVRVGIYNADGTLNGISAECSPNATTFSISSVDASVKFGSLSAGMYTYCIEACDTNDAYEILLMQPFSVGSVSGSTVTFTYTVTASSLNLRSGPSTSYSTVGSLPNGTAIEVQKVLNGWAYTTYNGVSGWCSMSYLDIQESYNSTATPVPAATPATLTGNMFFNADYTTGSTTDTIGKLEGSKGTAGTVSFVTNSTGTKVAAFDGEACLEYDLAQHANKVASDFTMETYVMLKDIPNAWANIAGTYWHNNTSGFGIGYGQFSTIGTGASEFSFSTGVANSSTTYNTAFAGASSGQWVHLVYSNNGSTEVLYVNGSKVSEKTLPVSNITFDDERTFRIGGYNTVGQFCADMECAFVRLYARAATASEVSALYAARPSLSAATPTPVPTEEPTPDPLTVTYTSGKTDGKITDAVALNETFSIEVYAIPTDNGYLIFNARYPVELSDGHIGVWEFTHPGVAFTSNTEIKIGEPVHLVITGSGDTLKLYINGQYDSSTSGEMVLGNDNFNFGNIMQLGLNAGSEYVFNVYNREATAEEVTELYAPYKPISKSEELGSLIFVSRPAKLYYAVGEELDLTGLSVVIKDENSVEAPVALEDCTITGDFNSSTVGAYLMTIRYETEDVIYSNTFTLTVRLKTTVTGIGLAVKPSKLYYKYGEALDTSGLSVLVKYLDGTTETITEGLAVTGYDATVPGDQRLTVSYGGQSTSFSVKVYPGAARSVIGVGLETKPEKLAYTYGEELDITGLTVLAKYSDGTIVHSISEGVEVTGYDAAALGNQRLTVAYEGHTTSFTVKVA